MDLYLANSNGSTPPARMSVASLQKDDTDSRSLEDVS